MLQLVQVDALELAALEAEYTRMVQDNKELKTLVEIQITKRLAFQRELNLYKTCYDGYMPRVVDPAAEELKIENEELKIENEELRTRLSRIFVINYTAGYVSGLETENRMLKQIIEDTL